MKPEKRNEKQSGQASFAERLKQLITSSGGTRPFAAKAAASEGTVRAWLERGAEPSRDKLAAIANATGVSLDWLISGRGPKVYSECPPGYVAIPFYDLQKSGGYLRDVAGPDRFLFFDRALVGLEANEQPDFLALNLLPAAESILAATDFVIVDRGGADLVPASLRSLSESESYRRQSLDEPGMICAIIAEGRVQVRGVRFTGKPKPIILFDAAGPEKLRRFERDDEMLTVRILGPVRFRAGIGRPSFQKEKNRGEKSQ